VEHAKIHLHRDLIKIQLLDKIHSPLLDASICKAIMECGWCKNFGPMHVHALLVPMTRRRPFEALASDYLSMPTGKGGFGKIGLYIDVFARKLWGFKSKTAAGKNTVDNLRRITQAFTAPEVLIVDGGSHFDCNEVREYCETIGTKLHVIAAYSPWLNGLLEGSNSILLNALKCLCAPGLGEDEYERMTKEDLPSNWLEYLDAAIKYLNDCILPSLKYSPDEIKPPTVEEIDIHLVFAEQQHLDGYTATIDHTIKRRAAFASRLRQQAPKNIIFQPGDLVQVHTTQWVHTFVSIKKLIPMWSTPYRVATQKLNSYTLKTLNGLPLEGVYNSRRL
jgi:transposase InsO family protein